MQLEKHILLSPTTLAILLSILISFNPKHQKVSHCIQPLIRPNRQQALLYIVHVYGEQVTILLQSGIIQEK